MSVRIQASLLTVKNKPTNEVQHIDKDGRPAEQIRFTTEQRRSFSWMRL